MEETTNRLEQAEEARFLATAKQQLAGTTLDPDRKKSYEDFSGESSQRRMAAVASKIQEDIGQFIRDTL